MVKRDSPSAQRNKEPIWSVMEQHILPELISKHTSDQIGCSQTLRILEIAAGAGVHTEYFASKLHSAVGMDLDYIPSDPETTSRDSIEAYRQDAALTNVVQPPVPLTLHGAGILQRDHSLEDNSLSLIICINMIHISPWSATIGLMKTAQKLLQPNGMLYCYGPYKERGTAVESNLRFDQSLQSRDPSWGVRDLEQVVALAEEHGLTHWKTIPMPANNLSVIYQKSGTQE